jgi:hypothetical protein
MSKPLFSHFLKVEPISDSSIFKEFEEEDLYYYYCFQISEIYYLFLYGLKNTRYKSIDFLSEMTPVLQVKKRIE